MRRPTPPTPDDGRNLDVAVALQLGEGAQQRVDTPESAWPVPPEAAPTPGEVPSETYYDLPVVKAPPWRWYIPAYFYAGGVAGAAATLGGALELVATTRPELRLAHRLHWISMLGEAAGSALLIADLGRPARFHHMLRVIRPTSPMNVGTWILSTAGATSGLSALARLRGRRPPGLVLAANVVAGSLLSTYTGVLVGNTAVPIWKVTRRRLPLWFAATSAAALGSLLQLSGGATRATRVYTAAAKVAELVGAHAIERAAREVAIDAPLREGHAGRLWRSSRWLGVASLVTTLLPWGGRTRDVIAGALGTASSVLARFAIHEAGKASAADPRATFDPQRRGAIT